MRENIDIYLGKLIENKDEPSRVAYLKNAASKIAAAVGWTADGDTMYSPDGNARIKVWLNANGTKLSLGAGTRFDESADWADFAWSDDYKEIWGCTYINERDVYATIVKSVSGKTWAIKLRSGDHDGRMQFAVFTNANGKVWIHGIANSSYTIYELHDGIKITSAPYSIIYPDYFRITTNAEATMLIPMPDPYRGSYFVDLYHLISITSSDCYSGDEFYANGAYYRLIGHGYLIRTA